MNFIIVRLNAFVIITQVGNLLGPWPAMNDLKRREAVRNGMSELKRKE